MSDISGNVGGDDGNGNGNTAVGNGGNERTSQRLNIRPASRGAPVTVAPANIGHNPNAEPDTGTASGDNQPRRRGRPPGSRNRAARASDAALDLSGIQAALTSAHLVLSAVTKNPKWILDDAEAKSLADAIRNATRHHDIAVAQKTVDYVNLAIVASMVYGTRIITIQRERAAARQAQQPEPDAAAMAHANSGGVVHQFSGH